MNFTNTFLASTNQISYQSSKIINCLQKAAENTLPKKGKFKIKKRYGKTTNV